jgi:hypothetical protein
MKVVIGVIFIALIFMAICCSPTTISTTTIGASFSLAKENDEIELPLRQDIHKLDDSIVKVLQTGSADELFGYFFTGTMDEEQLRQNTKDNFPALSQTIADKQFKLYQDFHCTFGGGGSASGIVLPNKNHDFQISIPRVTDEMFISLLESQEFNQLLLSITYAKQGDDWKVWSIRVGSFKIAEKDAVQWYEEALTYYNQGYLVPALFRLEMANTCLYPAPCVTYQKEANIVKLAEKAQSEFESEYSMPLYLSNIEGKPMIYGIRPQFVQGDIIPAIWYVTSIKLENGSGLENEANTISPIVQQMFPGIVEGTEYILFKAFSEPPSDPNKIYQSYGTVVKVR